MATTTTNFGWDIPQSTDLVKDGATAIAALGQDIDTALVDLKGGTTGQVLAKASNTDLDYSWVTTDDANAIQNAIVNAKGDIIGASANDVPAITSVGNNGEMLLADSSTSTGLRWQGSREAGKNLIINGDFSVWQRGTSFTNPSFADYTADRWRNQNYDNAPTTYSITRETFTPGAAPVQGFEGQFFFRSTLTTIGSCTIYDTCGQRIEGVLGSNTPMTISFYAKSDSTRTQSIFWFQNYGSGGSGDASFSVGPTFSTTTAWQRFTFTATSPNNTGKTIGANAYAMMYIRQAAASGSVLDVWGVQIEYGSVATPFQTASGSTGGGELALCQRYFNQLNISNNNTAPYGFGFFFSTTSARYLLVTPVTMRATPTLGGTTGNIAIKGGATSLTPSTFGLTLVSGGAQVISAVVGGITDQALIASINTTITLSAEL
jgi:hypothetical protein